MNKHYSTAEATGKNNFSYNRSDALPNQIIYT